MSSSSLLPPPLLAIEVNSASPSENDFLGEIESGNTRCWRGDGALLSANALTGREQDLFIAYLEWVEDVGRVLPPELSVDVQMGVIRGAGHLGGTALRDNGDTLEIRSSEHPKGLHFSRQVLRNLLLIKQLASYFPDEPARIVKGAHDVSDSYPLRR
jgi:hypothetical protein